MIFFRKNFKILIFEKNMKFFSMEHIMIQAMIDIRQKFEMTPKEIVSSERISK